MWFLVHWSECNEDLQEEFQRQSQERRSRRVVWHVRMSSLKPRLAWVGLPGSSWQNILLFLGGRERPSFDGRHGLPFPKTSHDVWIGVFSDSWRIHEVSRDIFALNETPKNQNRWSDSFAIRKTRTTAFHTSLSATKWRLFRSNFFVLLNLRFGARAMAMRGRSRRVRRAYENGD